MCKRGEENFVDLKTKKCLRRSHVPMHKKLEEWFEIYGRRLAELKIAGGEEFFTKGERDITKLDNLSGGEWIEFFSLIGQLDGIVWTISPDDKVEAKKIQREAARHMEKLEKYSRHVWKVTGKISILRGDS